MVWGAITANSKSSLIHVPKGRRTAAGFVDVVYYAKLGHYIYSWDNARELVLTKNGAPVHRSVVTATWRNNGGLVKLNWPANFLDFNPIENLWFVCTAYVVNGNRFLNQGAMFALVERVWSDIDQGRIADMIRTMPKRIAAILAADSSSTRR